MILLHDRARCFYNHYSAHIRQSEGVILTGSFFAFFDYLPWRVSISSQTEFEELNDQPSNRAKNKLLLEGAARPAKEENVK